MNIFFLDKNPLRASSMYGDKHIGKLIVEVAQMCSTALHRHGLHDEAPYKSAYEKHPMTIWVGDSVANFEWVVSHGMGLGNQWHNRFGTAHKGIDALCEISVVALSNKIVDSFPQFDFTVPPQCMPDEYKQDGGTLDDTIMGYKRYYTFAKTKMHKWTKTNKPKFIEEVHNA
jgi:hypothetical protein